MDFHRFINLRPGGGSEKSGPLSYVYHSDLQENSLLVEQPSPESKEVSGGLKLSCFEDIKAETVSWLWYPYIPLGKITLMQGDPGSGKTYLSAALASLVSNGRPFPGESTSHKPANVLFQNGEDGAADTIKPRLEKTGAKARHIFRIDEVASTGKITIQNLDGLRSVLAEIQPLLVVIDPLQLYLGSDIDMNRANELRPVMAGLARLAEEYQCALIIVMHLNKGSGQKALYRGLGSIDLPAIARSILLVGENPNQLGERLMVHIKSSLAPVGKTQRFELSPEQGLNWTGTSDHTATDLLDPPKPINGESALGEAISFILEALKDGPKLAITLETEAKEAGIAPRTLVRARGKLKDEGQIRSRKMSVGWIWEIR